MRTAGWMGSVCIGAVSTLRADAASVDLPNRSGDNGGRGRNPPRPRVRVHHAGGGGGRAGRRRAARRGDRGGGRDRQVAAAALGGGGGGVMHGGRRPGGGA